MARCTCGPLTCACTITAGAGFAVSGTGTLAGPVVVSTAPAIGNAGNILPQPNGMVYDFVRGPVTVGDVGPLNAPDNEIHRVTVRVPEPGRIYRFNARAHAEFRNPTSAADGFEHRMDLEFDGLSAPGFVIAGRFHQVPGDPWQRSAVQWFGDVTPAGCAFQIVTYAGNTTAANTVDVLRSQLFVRTRWT